MPKPADDFSKVENYCMFIGYPRSGHTLPGAFLDAHPEMVVCHELDALQFVAEGISRKELLQKIVNRSRWFLKQRNLHWQGFDYHVPNQWQGRYQEIRVIGDKKGGQSTVHLAENPELIEKLLDVVKLPLRIFHHTRNPFDVIATNAKRNNRTLKFATKRFFEMADTCAKVSERYSDAVMTVAHEDLIADPRAAMREYVEFVGCEAGDDYLNDCASLVFAKPSKTREAAGFPKEMVEEIMEQIQRYPFLTRYTFE